jgi:hypothetical protein
MPLGGCPLHWVSKSQTEIALSTLEAEYNALPQVMRDLIPLRSLFSEVGQTLKLDFATIAKMHSKVFEDNNGALCLALSPRMTLRTKYIGVKYHFFKSHIGEEKGIMIHKIESAQQKADIFIKGVTRGNLQDYQKAVGRIVGKELFGCEGVREKRTNTGIDDFI